MSRPATAASRAGFVLAAGAGAPSTAIEATIGRASLATPARNRYTALLMPGLSGRASAARRGRHQVRDGPIEFRFARGIEELESQLGLLVGTLLLAHVTT